MAKKLTGEPLARVKSNGWHWLKLFGPSEDNHGHTMEDGTYYPPTYSRNVRLAALRSDGEYFEVNMTFRKDEIDWRTLELVTAKLHNTLMTFDTFRTCGCTAEKRCSAHG